MDTKLMVDVATAVMDNFDLMSDMDEDVTEHFCQQLEKSFKEAAAGAPDLRSAILGLKQWTQGANGEDTEGFDYYEAAAIDAALASAAPVEAPVLTSHEITVMWHAAQDQACTGIPSPIHFARAIEARIKGVAK